MDWDDLRYFLALARERAVRPAAKRLRVSHSTVARRIQVFEERLGVRLFDRTPDGYQLTPAGERILNTAESLEEDIAAMRLDVLDADSRLEGDIRITLPNMVLHTPIMNDIAAFAQTYPDIDLEIVQSDELVDLSRREADIAIRFLPTDKAPPGHLIGRKLVTSHHGVYVARDGLRNPDTPSFLGWEEGVRSPLWVKGLPVPNVSARHHIADPLGQAEACAAGMGYAILSCYHADNDPRLQRLANYPTWPARDIWLLSHPDVRATTRFRLFRETIAKAISDRQAEFEGKLEMLAELPPHQ